MSAALAPAFDNTYARELPGFYVEWQPASVRAPRLLFLNEALADELGLPLAALRGDEGLHWFSGNALPPGAQPIAQAYAGHQFGGFSPQLGDGRALLVGELLDRHGRRRDLAFKGSGRTPFSRGGDGKAAVGPMLREVIIGEAMHALGIPTTRALAVAATGEVVLRETKLPGAVLTRVAASHLRVGTFQYFAARGEDERVRRLVDYAIARHDPQLLPATGESPAADPQRVLAWLQAVAQRQAALVARWMNVGFIHGVMNTDNMTISGETIDYGPCAFMEACDPAAVFSSIDHHGRYAYGNQPLIARWNLARLAETVLPLLAEDGERAVALATGVIDAFPGWFQAQLLAGQRVRLGLLHAAPGDESLAQADAALADDFLALLQGARADFTLGWRHLAAAALGDETRLAASLGGPDAAQPWLTRWRERLLLDDAHAGRSLPADARAQAMRRASPWIVPRNHRVEEALAAASQEGDLAPLERLLAALRQPFDEQPCFADLAEPAPAAVTACYRTFCGT